MISFADVLETVAQESGQDKRLLLGPRRYRCVAYPRQLVMLIARERCPWASTNMVGRWLDRDHTTVCSGIRAAKKRLETDEDYRALYEAVLSRLDIHDIAEAAE